MNYLTRKRQCQRGSVRCKFPLLHYLYPRHFFASDRPHTLLRITDDREDKLSPKQVEYFEQHMNRNSAFSVFLPQQNALPFIGAFKRARPGDFLRQFTDLHGQTVWNINFRQDALMLTGESQIEDNKNQYVSLFSRHQKTDQRLYRYFPEHTMLYIEYSVSDRQRWFSDLRTWQDHDTPAHTLDGQAAQIDSDTPDLLRDFESAIGNNFALVEQSNSDFHSWFFSIQDTRGSILTGLSMLLLNGAPIKYTDLAIPKPHIDSMGKPSTHLNAPTSPELMTSL